MGRPLLLVVSAALAWGATMAMEVEDSMNVNPYEGTDHKSSGLLFYGDERDGCRSLAQRCYDCIDNVEQFKEIIYEYALWIYSVPRWIILRRRGVSTLPRDHSQGLLAQRADWWDIYDRWGRKGYVRRAAEITAGKVAYHAGVVTTALMPGPLCEQVGEGPPGCAVALSFAGIVAHFSGLITLPLGGLNMPACHWGFYVIMAAALGLYAYVNGWTPSRNKLGLFVLNMVTRIYLAYFMAIVVADFEFLQTHSTFVIPANLKQTSFYNDDGNASKHIIGWLWQFWHWMMCDWPSLGLGMPFCVAIYDRIGDTAHLVPQSVALRPGSTRIKVPDWPSTIKVYDANDDAYRDDPDPAALNIQALNIIVPTPAGVVAALRDLL